MLDVHPDRARVVTTSEEARSAEFLERHLIGQLPAIQIRGRWRIKKSTMDRDILRQDKQGQPTVLAI